MVRMRIERRTVRAPEPGIEPISIFLACATAAIWDAVLDGGRRRVLDVHKAVDGDEMRPNRPIPKGCRQNGCLLCCSSSPCAPDSVSRRVVRAGAQAAASDTLDPVRHASAPPPTFGT